MSAGKAAELMMSLRPHGQCRFLSKISILDKRISYKMGICAAFRFACAAILLSALMRESLALEGKQLHDTVEAMRNSKHTKYTKSHKKFRFFDVDDSETVTATEFAAGLKELGYKTSARKLDHIMGELDIDKDGAVTFVEFMRPTAKKYKEEEELENMADTDRAFEHLDSDFDGQVDPVEFYEGLSHLPGMAEISRPDIEDFFKSYADVDGDGFLDYEELESIEPDLIKVNVA